MKCLQVVLSLYEREVGLCQRREVMPKMNYTHLLGKFGMLLMHSGLVYLISVFKLTAHLNIAQFVKKNT